MSKRRGPDNERAERRKEERLMAKPGYAERKAKQLEREEAAKAEEESVFEKDIDLEDSFHKAEDFVDKNKGLLIGGIAALALLTILYFGFMNWYIPNQEKAAQESMFQAQTYFANDDYQKALDGDGENEGFLDVISNYSGWTKSTNLAKYYAGISYLNLGDFDSAIEYLGKFKRGDKTLGAMADGAMGDAYMENGDTANGLSYYKKAATYKNEFTGPMFLMKAGLAAEAQNDMAAAKSSYESLKNTYPESVEARNADKYIARVSSKL